MMNHKNENKDMTMQVLPYVVGGILPDEFDHRDMLFTAGTRGLPRKKDI
jgi:hypothetical protein